MGGGFDQIAWIMSHLRAVRAVTVSHRSGGCPLPWSQASAEKRQRTMAEVRKEGSSALGPFSLTLYPNLSAAVFGDLHHGLDPGSLRDHLVAGLPS